jgi:hypothetical protein
MFRSIATLASLVAVAGMLAASSSQAASQWTPQTKTNSVTFSKAVSLPAVTLSAGTYVFESGPVASAGAVAPVLAWHPVGSMLRHEFMYR